MDVKVETSERQGKYRCKPKRMVPTIEICDNKLYPRIKMCDIREVIFCAKALKT